MEVQLVAALLKQVKLTQEEGVVGLIISLVPQVQAVQAS
jgi:hypothetical protein